MTAAAVCRTIATLAANLRRRHPHLADDLDDIAHLADEITRTYPLAASCIDPGDGLRSPSLDGPGGSKGSVSRPTETTALDHVDRGRLTVSLADALIADAVDSLRQALSVVGGVSAPIPLGDGLRAGDGTSEAYAANWGSPIDERTRSMRD